MGVNSGLGVRPSVLWGAGPGHLAVNGEAYTAMQVRGQLGNTCSLPDGGGLPARGTGNYLTCPPGAACAVEGLHAPLAFLGTTMIPPFLGHLGNKDPKGESELSKNI